MRFIHGIGFSLFFVAVFYVDSSYGREAAFGGRFGTPAEFARNQINLYFYNGVELPKVTSAERRRFEAEYENASSQEAELLDRLLPNKNLKVLAVRDWDGDGVKDFKLDNGGLKVDGAHPGKFFENDIDVDADGVINLFDADPFDADVGIVDSNQNGVPDSIDYAFSPEHSFNDAEIQRILMRDFSVVVADRSAKFSSSDLELIDLLVRNYLADKPRMDFRAIVAEDQYGLNYADGTMAVVEFSQILSVYIKQFEPLSPLLKLGILVHEFAHLYQNNMDGPFDDDEYATLNFETPNQDTLVREFGWYTRVKKLKKNEIFNQFFLVDAVDSLINIGTDFYNGHKSSTWIKYYSETNAENQPAYARDNGFVSDYSLAGPCEYHSEFVRAYFYFQVHSRLIERFGSYSPEFNHWKEALEFETLEWERIQFLGIGFAHIFSHLEAEFSVSVDSLDTIYDTWLTRALPEIPKGPKALDKAAFSRLSL